MISFLKGILVAKAEQSPRGAYFLVDVHGVGFEVSTSSRSVASAPVAGGNVLLYTSLIVREDAMGLVGFNSREERDLFNILQSASGVGVKVSLALLSTLSVSEIAQSVVSGEYKLLTAAKGVGPKLAQKIVLELKEKMTAWRDLALDEALSGQRDALAKTASVPGAEEAYREAETVLLSLGYSQREVLDSLAKISENQAGDKPPASEDVLRDALQYLALV